MLRNLLFLLLSVFPVFVSAMDFTTQEQEYLRTHREITLCVDPDWYPFESVTQDGEHIGIAADILKLVERRTGLNLKLYRTPDWDASIKASKEGRCDVLSFLNKTPEREKWLIFTEPHFTDVNVFITRQEHKYITDPAALDGETIVFPEGTAMEELVRTKYPNLKIKTTESEKHAFEAVDAKKADMTMRSLIMAAYTIRKEGYFNLKVAGQLPDFTNQFRIGVVRTEPVLRDILNKGVQSITPQEKEHIINNHVYIEIKSGVDYTLVFQVAAVFIITTLVSLFWGYRVNRLNKKLEIISSTDMLTGIYNRTKITGLYHLEFERAVRYGRALSVIIMDIDHFKSINDSFGHLVGDRVLKQFAASAGSVIRNCDHIGRWGGEEFIIICPETEVEDCKSLADRIRITISQEKYPTGQVHTVSCGVAGYQEGDTEDSLLTRADAAMYRAKKEGRNNTCL